MDGKFVWFSESLTVRVPTYFKPHLLGTTGLTTATTTNTAGMFKALASIYTMKLPQVSFTIVAPERSGYTQIVLSGSLLTDSVCDQPKGYFWTLQFYPLTDAQLANMIDPFESLQLDLQRRAMQKKFIV